MALLKKKEIKLPHSLAGFDDNNDIISNLTEFINTQQLYRSAIREVQTKLEILADEFNVHYDYNPIHHIETRLKSPESILEKLQRKQFELSIDSVRHKLTDVAGIRVICNYIEDVYLIEDLLTKQDDIELLRRSDYIKKPKENGYRSLHLIVTVPVFLSERTEIVPVEVQVRTIAMDFWASLEHKLKYKSVEDASYDNEVYDELKNCADIIADIDERMHKLYQKIYNMRDNESNQQIN